MPIARAPEAEGPGAPADISSVSRLQEEIAFLAYQALLKEVLLTPKPGLVDLRNSGAHRDMDVCTFLTSAVVLRPWFAVFFGKGLSECRVPADLFLPSIRPDGMACERDMLAATGGINTHKGSIFAFGLLCAAAGRLAGQGRRLSAQALCREVAAMTTGVLDELSGAREATTAGELFFRRYGMTGARGEAASGFATVRRHSLPAYRTLRLAGADEDAAMSGALLELLAFNPDTNLVARGGEEGLRFMQEQSRRLKERGGILLPDFEARMHELDQKAISLNLSPGGSADLLAVTWFLAGFPWSSSESQNKSTATSPLPAAF